MSTTPGALNCDSIILTGMPGAGKSTVGPILSEMTGLAFIDTDELVKSQDGRDLKEIVAQDGYERFLAIQRKIVMSCGIRRNIVATGGGVVRDDELMRYFRSVGSVVYLRQVLETLEKRLAPGRKLVRTQGQTFRELFYERDPLYVKYADKIIDCGEKIPTVIAREIYSSYRGE